jgi:hypothetical protein
MMNNSVKKPQIIEKPRVIIVEGEDDKRLIGAILQKLQYDEVQIFSFEGNSDWGNMLVGTIRNNSNFYTLNSLGLVRDADQSAEGTFKSIQSALRKAGFPVPEKPLKICESTIDENHLIRTIIHILPSPNRSGTLEDLLLESVSTDPAMPCVNDYFGCLQRNNIKSNNESKARVHAFLASRPDGTLRTGDAAQKGYWPLDHDAFKEIKEFLRLLIS